MANVLKGLPQVSQDGFSLWLTDKSGKYVVTTNEGGWGTPNFIRNESALLAFVYRMSNPKVVLEVLTAAVAYSVSFDNETESAFQFEYLADGYHQYNMVRLMASSNDKESLDAIPITLTDEDIWYNTLDFQVKRMVLGVPVILDLTSSTDLDIILQNLGQNQSILLCEDIYYKQLSVEKNNRYTEMREARREENSSQVLQLRHDQMDIVLGSSTAAYQFSFGLKTEAQDTIETLLDDFNL